MAGQSEEQELERIAALPKFQARGFNRAALATSASMGQGRAERKQPTESLPFRFFTDDRASQRKQPEVRVGAGAESRAGRPLGLRGA